MSQTGTIRFLRGMIRFLNGQFESDHPTSRDSPAGRLAVRKIEALELAIFYVEQSFHPPSEELETWLLGREDDISFGLEDLGRLRGVFKAVFGREAVESD